MKKQSASRSAFFVSRVVRGLVLCSVGVLLASDAWSKAFAQAPSAPTHLRVSSVQFHEANAYANTTLTFKITDAPDHTYGYDVFADGTLIIHQTSVPALPGNEGFKTKNDATKVALLVIEKLRKGEMPPTISIDEMKQLNAIK
jgi:hypothetical protein